MLKLVRCRYVVDDYEICDMISSSTFNAVDAYWILILFSIDWLSITKNL